MKKGAMVITGYEQAKRAQRIQAATPKTKANPEYRPRVEEEGQGT